MSGPSNLSPNTATPGQELSLKHTNVSNPSIIRSQPSKQSITASEDYYSLSSSHSSNDTARILDDRGFATHTINRYSTPPSRYRTPLQSRDQLPSQSQINLAQSQNAEEEVRKTPMRGEGRRRRSVDDSSNVAVAGAPSSTTVLREGGVRRKPVPSTVMEAPSPASSGFIDPAAARSSAAHDIDREQSATTPGHDDTPYIRFALDQLSIDEQAVGPRRYPGRPAFPVTGGVVIEGGEPFQSHRQRQQKPAVEPVPRPAAPSRAYHQPETTYPRREAEHSDNHGGMGKAAAIGAGVLALGAATAAGVGYSRHRDTQQQAPPIQEMPDTSPRSPHHPGHVHNREPSRTQEPSLYVPIDDEEGFYERLNFLPGILRPLRLIFFMLLLLVLLALLLAAAIYSLTHNGIAAYGSFGDGKYFVFEYLPTLLGMLLLFWLIQIQVALYRIAPFIAMASPSSPRSWEEGAKLPIYPKTWFLPYTGHLRVPGLIIVGVFMIVAWLQIFTIPLLASAFNVYFFGAPDTGNWRWLATAALIWIVIAFYLFLFAATIALFTFLRQKRTGLKWDPRSLADAIVLLERSNALTLTSDDEIRHEPARLSYWRTSRGYTNEVFHTYGVASRPARTYSVRNGRLTEKTHLPTSPDQEPRSRFSDFEADPELGREQRHSREKMLPRRLSQSSRSSSTSSGGKNDGNAIPWFLRPSMALLWIILAIVLVVAFLVIAYLPSTSLVQPGGFDPMVPAIVNTWGYSGTNFLYSFVPALLATIAWLGMLDIDFAYRRLQPLSALLKEGGEVGEKSILLSYAADMPVLVTIRAAINGHFRVAALSLASLVSTVLPVLAGGCWWAQFDTTLQTVRIYTETAGFYALTVFVVLYALVIATCTFPGKKTRGIDASLPRGCRATRWRDLVALVGGSRVVDGVEFRGVDSKTGMVTRLVSAYPNNAGADAGVGNGVPRYTLGAYEGRDGREGWGVDRVRG
ncbi:uncharacterized protein LTR77_010745 [Saxophila tyrrhenica]|uniref:Phosphoribosylaminoimidazole-succinocarboxamide synthase n=1 Tax=Saxophila tyrrhenica TaxID=1690608 RepID=A0AAV9NV01_9PEZI|nr:hypothetical protein LTR77_010745 [Saxophila tyrrhenica]